MNAAPRLWTDVVSGAFGFAFFGLSSDADVFATATTDPGFAAFAGVVFDGVAVGLACANTVAGAGFAGDWFDHVADGFTVLSATAPTGFADDDEDAMTWRKNQPGFAPR